MVGDNAIDLGVRNDSLHVFVAQVGRGENDPARNPVELYHGDGAEKL